MTKPVIPDAALSQRRAQYYAAYYQAHKERWRERQRTGSRREYMRAYRLKNKSHLRVLHKDWCARNPERALEIAKKHQVVRRPRKRLADREYRKRNPGVYRAGIALARAASPELYRQIGAKSSLTRRARKKAAAIEPVSLKRIELRDRGCCHICRLSVSRPDRSFDHLIPVVRGGAHAEWNLMLAHVRCNQRRGTKQILEAETKEAAEAYIAARCGAGL